MDYYPFQILQNKIEFNKIIKMSYLIIIFISIFFIIFYKKYENNYRKKYEDTKGTGVVVKLVSFFIGKNINNIKNIEYDNMFNELINKLYIFNNNNKEYENMLDFEKDIWEITTNGKYYKYYKKFTIIISYFINNEYKEGLIHIIQNIYILPFIVFYMYKDSENYINFIFKVATLETLPKALQISSIMDTKLETVIRRMRFGRNIIVKDINSGEIFITRQVRQPMIGSQTCPFIKYVKKTFINVKLNYSLLVIEKEHLLKVVDYKCNLHKRCIVYKDEKKIIKHLNECEFWYDDKYWERKYPKEKELYKNNVF